MSAPLDQLRAAAVEKTAAQAALSEAHERFVAALLQAREAGAGERELAEVAGVTRQRVWQLLSR